MTNDLAELNRVVGEMPKEMVREVLNFAMFLQRKSKQEFESGDDGDSRFGAEGDGFDLMNRWDAVESPINPRDVV